MVVFREIEVCEVGFELVFLVPLFDEYFDAGIEVKESGSGFGVGRDGEGSFADELFGIVPCDVGACIITDDEEEKGVLAPLFSPSEEGTNDSGNNRVDCFGFK